MVCGVQVSAQWSWQLALSENAGDRRMLIDSETPPREGNRVPLETRVWACPHGAGSALKGKSGIHDTALNELLSRFESHGLGDIDKAKLMHRVDTKYLLPIRDLEPLLPFLARSYSVLEIDNLRLFSYRSTYYDTSGLEFYRMHHNGKKNRFKIRLRHYLDSGDQYVEVKHKTNKSVTRKNRVLYNERQANKRRINELVSIPFGANRPPLLKSLVCSYDRIALADENNGERLTLDLNLSFKDPKRHRGEQAHQVFVAEVKRQNRKIPSVFCDLMDRFRQKPISFSKYCIGCALIHSSQLKINRFKSTLMALDRMSRQRTAIAL
jgi:hypothetical protein